MLQMFWYFQEPSFVEPGLVCHGHVEQSQPWGEPSAAGGDREMSLCPCCRAEVAFSLTWRGTVGALASCAQLLSAESLLQVPFCTAVKHSSWPWQGGASMRSAASLALKMKETWVPFFSFPCREFLCLPLSPALPP